MTVTPGAGVGSVTGGGSYYAGELVTISAVVPPVHLLAPFGSVTFPSALGPMSISALGPPYAFPLEIDVFESWTSDNGGTFAGATDAATAFTMPDGDVAVRANTQKAYKLWVSGGHIISESDPSLQTLQLGYYLPGTEVPLGTNVTSPGIWFFEGWKESSIAPDGVTLIPGGGAFSNSNSIYTIYTMPAANTYVQAPWSQSGPTSPSSHTLTVVGGTGNKASEPPSDTIHNIDPGTWVRIEADPPEAWQVFSHWEISVFDNKGQSAAYQGAFIDVTGPATQFIMAEGDVTITAIYQDIRHMLIVVNGADETNQPSHILNEVVPIRADPSPAGQVFDKWLSSSNEGSFADADASATTFTMPADTVIVTATYKNAPGGNPGPGIGPPGLLDTDNHIAYVRGVGHNLFAPEKNTTRAETAQMIYNLLLNKDVNITKRFPDMPGSAWYAQAVNTLASLGILLGYPDGGFHPDASITRAEFTAIFVRFMEEHPDARQTSPFTDVPATHWAYDAINAAAAYGWITGYGNGRFEPDRPISRAEAVTLLNRVLQRDPDKAYINEHAELALFSDVPETHWAFYDIMEAYIPHDYVKDNGREKWK